jgi:acetyl-CoA carboxylase biotin carboxyl carrier protein
VADPDKVRQEATSLVRELLARLEREDVRELSVERGELRVRVQKAEPQAARAVVAAEVDSPVVDASPEPARPAAAGVIEVKAPLTGVFYRAPSAQAAPYVQVGSTVSVGQVIGLIEAMKLFNEIRSTAAGRVTRILAESGQLVRAHAPLIEVAPL